MYGWLFESHDDLLTHPRTVSEPVRTLFAKGAQRVRTTHWAFVERSLKLVSYSLLVLYEFFLGSFGICFQFDISSLSDHIRRISSAYVCVL